MSDEETIERAKAGHCIAREIPDEKELPKLMIGMPKDPVVQTPEQKEALKLSGREHAIDDSIKNADSKRSCPQCYYPAPPGASHAACVVSKWDASLEREK